MCSVCGCGTASVGHADHHHHGDHGHHHHDHGDAHAHHHGHGHDHGHHHGHDHDTGRLVQMERDILAKNNAYAAENRAVLAARGVLALNLLSSPGSGKTTLLVATLKRLAGQYPAAVIEGDQQTSVDADRIRAAGVRAVQINTGKGCHLDGHMVGHALQEIDPADDSVLFIENVGNLVCPAAFDLGEAHKVAILSVTEGEDKPLKYPDMFAAVDLILINKIDLLPHLDFNVETAIANARKVNPRVKAIEVSARTGEGLDDWLAWIEGGRAMMQAGSKRRLSAS